MGEAKRRKDIMRNRISKMSKDFESGEAQRKHIKDHEPELDKYLECGFIIMRKRMNASAAMILKHNKWLETIQNAQDLIDSCNSDPFEWGRIDWKND